MGFKLTNLGDKTVFLFTPKDMMVQRFYRDDIWMLLNPT